MTLGAKRRSKNPPTPAAPSQVVEIRTRDALPSGMTTVVAGGHVDGLAVGIAVLALAVLGRTVVLAREPGQ
jgi:hypothetical protein